MEDLLIRLTEIGLRGHFDGPHVTDEERQAWELAVACPAPHGSASGLGGPGFSGWWSWALLSRPRMGWGGQWALWVGGLGPRLLLTSALTSLAAAVGGHLGKSVPFSFFLLCF